MKYFSDRKIMILLYLTTFLIAVIPGLFLHTIIVTDETGTIGNAAGLANYDWRILISANGAYYKYGQALFYYPLFLFFQNSDFIFKGIQIINAFLISFVPVICFLLGTKCLSLKRNYIIGMSFIIGVLPPSLLISKYAWSESILVLLPWLLLFITILSYEIIELNTRKRVFSILAGVIAGYAFMSHQRGIVLIIALILLSLFFYFFEKKRIFDLRYLLATIIFMIIFDHFLSIYFKDILGFLESDIKANTLEASLDFAYLSKIFTFRGFWILLKSIGGWLFAVISETYGLILLGAWCAISNVYHYFIKRKQNDMKIVIISVFSLIIFILAFAMGILFFYKGIYMFFTGEAVKRADRLVYTRYIDSTIGPLCLLAVYQLIYLRDKIKWKQFFLYFFCYLFIIIFFKQYISVVIDNVVVWLHAMLGIGMFINPLGNEIGYVQISSLSNYLFIFSIYSIIVFSCIYFQKRIKIMLTILFIVFILNYLVSFYNIVYSVNNYYKNVINVVVSTTDDLNELSVGNKYIYCDSDLFREGIQFYLKDYIIIRLNHLKDDIDNMFILSEGDKYNLNLYESDFYEIENSYHWNGYHLYIKGIRLKNEIEALGFNVIEIPATEVLENGYVPGG